MDEVIQIGTHIGINNFCACFAHVWKAGANWYSFGTLYCHYFKMKIFLEQKKLNYFVQKNNSKIIYAQDIDFSTFWVSEKVKSCNQPLQFKTGTICLFVLAFLPKITFSLGIFLLCTVKPSLSFLLHYSSSDLRGCSLGSWHYHHWVPHLIALVGVLFGFMVQHQRTTRCTDLSIPFLNLCDREECALCA